MDGNQARALLGVPPHASTGQIRRAFRGAAFVAHPDRGGDAGTFRRLLAARDALLPAEARPRSPATGDPFAQRLRPPNRPRFSVLDSTRRAPARSVEPPEHPDFERILADLLAA